MDVRRNEGRRYKEIRWQEGSMRKWELEKVRRRELGK